MFPDEQAAADLQRKHLEPLMHTYQVNLAFWGHNHNYERSCKVLGKVCRSDGITHIVVGTGGKSLHKRWKVQSYSRFRNTTYGHAIVSVKNKTALLVEFFRSEDMKVIDHVWIKKQEEIPSPKGSSSVLTVSLIIYVAMTVALCWQIRFKP